MTDQPITLTDTQHFLLAGPIVLLTLLHLFRPGRARWLPWVAVPLLVAYGGNWEDPLGPVSDILVNASALGTAWAGAVHAMSRSDRRARSRAADAGARRPSTAATSARKCGGCTKRACPTALA